MFWLTVKQKLRMATMVLKALAQAPQGLAP